METRLGLGLNGFGHFVEGVGRLVDPTPLAAGLRPRLRQCRPKAQGAIANPQRWWGVQTARLQVLENGEPGRFRLPIAIRQRQQALLPLFVDPDQDQQAQTVAFARHCVRSRWPVGSDQDQQAQTVAFAARRRIEAIRPHVDIVLIRKVATVPDGIRLRPFRLEAAHHRW